MPQLGNVVLCNNPHAQFALGQMRDRDLPTEKFRKASDEVAMCLAAAVSHDHPSAQNAAVLAPILRAGLALEPAFMKMFWRRSPVHHIGLERDEKTFVPKSYYPRRGHRLVPPGMLSIVIDPMNATGGSGLFGLRALRDAGATKMVFVNVIASVEGVARVQSEFPDVTIYTVAVDPELDANKYIVPGLGDYGDRFYGTESFVL